MFDEWKDYLGGSGAKYARVQGGWMRCDPDGTGKYDWAWMDGIVTGMFARGVEPWLEASYGNERYPSGGDNSSSSPFPTGQAALKGWRDWVTAAVCRYAKAADRSTDACAGIERAPGLASSDGVGIWEIWNEPKGHSHATLPVIGAFENMTATVVRAANPSARIWVGALAGVDTGAAKSILSTMESLGGLGLVESVTYHPYQYDPDEVYGGVDQLAKVVGSFGDGSITIRQGENGAPSVKGTYGALSDYNWTQCSQAKWTTRRMLGDHGRGIWSSIFSIVDMCYDEKENNKGLLQADCPSKKVVAPKTAYYAYNAIASVLDDSWVLRTDANITVSPAAGSFGGYVPEGFVYQQNVTGELLATIWLKGHTPTNADDTPLVTSTVTIAGDGLSADDLCWVDPIALTQWRVASWHVGHGVYTVDDVPVSDYASFLVACPEAR